jgi:hypothetical protein
MKANLIQTLAVTPFVIFTLAACSPGKSAKYASNSESSLGDPTTPGCGGCSVPGVGALSVPTGDALVARIQNGLDNNVSPQSGNFKNALAQSKTNLPKVTDPTKATGFDQAELLIYAACSDLTTGGTPQMQSKYGVTKAGSIATNQNALIAAGISMLDKHTAGLASQGPTAAAVRQAFTDIVTKVSSAGGNTSTIAFVSVCIAANTAGATLMSY